MKDISLSVKPGICGFSCTIKAKSHDQRAARVEIEGSECEMIQEYGPMVAEISFHEMFHPLTQNIIFLSAERSKCHLACPVPTAVAKAAEAALILALPQNVLFQFDE